MDCLPKAAEEPTREYGSNNTHRSKDILGRVYEYFLGQFASAQGKKGGQWSAATSTAAGSPKGERNSAHQYPSSKRGNANFAWVQHFIHHLAAHGMAGFVLVLFWFWVKHGCNKTRSREETVGALWMPCRACPCAPRSRVPRSVVAVWDSDVTAVKPDL